MQIAFLIMLFIIGSCLGSFLCCQARRLHHKTKKIKSKETLGPRSVCLSCHTQLKWYDNIPIISWLFLKGRCRFCRHKIGCAEILSELGLGISFLVVALTINIYTASPLVWVDFVVLLLFMSLIGFLAIYDGLYGELPTTILIFSIVVAAIHLIIQECLFLVTIPFSFAFIWDPLISALILGGLYLFLYLISKGRWVGDGDWLLGTAIALVLFHPWLSLNALFITNLTACLIMLPYAKKHRTRQIHLGPFLVVGFVVVYSVSSLLMDLIGR